ncbi:MAG: trimethylamine methyltransferase family protein, partial [Candidatus Competibacteraceae bacterium]|nr:trimethylamine methyltransferase family protein [Candidatus Competibacteraceae bacterium]
MSEIETRRSPRGVSRRGARAAMIAKRNAPLPDAMRPVRAGLEGGRYRLLSEADIQKIHHAALDILATIGLADAIPSCIAAVTAAGGELNAQGRLLFPAALV